MEILQVVSVALIATVVLVLFRQIRPELAVPLGVLAGVMLLLFVLRQIGAIVRLMTDLLDRADVNLAYVDSLLRMVGIAYLTEFGAQVCRDCG